MKFFFAILFIGELLSDANMVIKIFAFMMIASFIKNRLGTSPMAIVAMIGIGWFVLFDYWMFFGGIFVLYLLLLFGVSSVLIDFFFVMPSGQPGAGGGGPDEVIPGKMGGKESPRWQSPVNSGADVARRMRQAQIARGRGPGG